MQITLTVAEALEVIRSAGISMSQETLQQGIIQKVFPFGDCVRLRKNVFLIYTKKLNEYLKDVGCEGVEE